MPVGGKLKFKGGKEPPRAGGIKKKKKKDKVAADGSKELVVTEAAGGENGMSAADAGKVEPKRTADGVVLAQPDPTADRRTEAEKKLDAHFSKYEAERAKKEAGKSHRDKIRDLNEKLASMTEHYDLFRVSYTA